MPSWYCHDNKWPNDSVFFFVYTNMKKKILVYHSCCAITHLQCHKVCFMFCMLCDECIAEQTDRE